MTTAEQTEPNDDPAASETVEETVARTLSAEWGVTPEEALRIWEISPSIGAFTADARRTLADEFGGVWLHDGRVQVGVTRTGAARALIADAFDPTMIDEITVQHSVRTLERTAELVSGRLADVGSTEVVVRNSLNAVLVNLDPAAPAAHRAAVAAIAQEFPGIAQINERPVSPSRDL